MKHLLTILGLTLSLGLAAQSVGLPTAGARGMAMGGAAVAFQDIHALFSNPAGIAHITEWNGLAAAEQRFLLSEIRAVSAGVALPSGLGCFGLSAQYFGMEAFNQQRVGLSYGRLLFEKLSIGGSFHYWNTRIAEYGSQGVLSFELGLQGQISQDLWMGLHAYNPIRTELAAGEDLPTILTVGLGYRPSPKVLVTGALSKDIDYPLQVSGGVEYQIAAPLLLRAGFQTQPVQGSVGAGVIWGPVRFDFSTRFHNYLGWSPGFGLTYQPPE